MLIARNEKRFPCKTHGWNRKKSYKTDETTENKTSLNCGFQFRCAVF